MTWDEPQLTPATHLPTSVQVLIIGGGPVGLSAAVELGQQGVGCLVVEPRSSILRLKPRAKTTNIRTMEFFRRWGLAGAVRMIAPLKPAWSQDVVFCTTLMGKEVTRFSGSFGLFTGRRDFTPEAGQQIAQPLIEEVLRGAVSALPQCQLALGWSLQSARQDEHGVHTVLVNERGEQHAMTAQYALGCDGSRSVLRTEMGVQYSGTSDARANLGVVFRAPGLAERQPNGRAVQYWILNPGTAGLMGRMDLEDQWWAIVNGVRDGDDPGELINAMVGEDTEAEVLATDPWTARMLLAERYRVGRMFLLGDAAHLNPPWGGHGFNTGIGDAVNLGWKLAAVFAGWGGETLLNSYEAERRPVARAVIEEATANMSVLAPELTSADLGAPGEVGERARAAAGKLIQASKDREFHSLGLVLGARYDGSPVTVDDGSVTPPTGQDYVPTARPGARLPHLWLPDGSSLYDHIRFGFTVLRLRPTADVGSFVTAASRADVPLSVVDVDGHEALYGAPLVLVRPDHHVVWRGETPELAIATALLNTGRGVLPDVTRPEWERLQA